MYSEKRKICVEYDGPVHFLPIFGQEVLEQRQERDSIEKKFFAEFEIKLIRISEKVYKGNKNWNSLLKEAINSNCLYHEIY